MIGHKIGVGVFPGQPVNFLDGTIGAQMSRCQQDISSASPQNLLPLDADRIGVALSEELQLHPEQSTDALVVHHPEAIYFNAG